MANVLSSLLRSLSLSSLALILVDRLYVIDAKRLFHTYTYAKVCIREWLACSLRNFQVTMSGGIAFVYRTQFTMKYFIGIIE